MSNPLLEAFNPRAIPPDRPGYPLRAQHFQNPSDIMRDAARTLAKRMIALCPDPSFHPRLVNVLHDLVVDAEKALQVVLESRADFDGYTYEIEHAPYREIRGDACEPATEDASEPPEPPTT